MSTDNSQLGYRERDQLFKKYYIELKIKVALNWFELVALLVVSLFGSFKLVKAIGMQNRVSCFLCAVVIACIITALFGYIRKYRLSINRFDKERIYKRVSNELHQNFKDN
ncbi:MAG: hypothetical protein P1U41_10485 [Vicingaceae bacterium]|nr:hypothetical protein [Vicingaceae bacterium]